MSKSKTKTPYIIVCPGADDCVNTHIYPEPDMTHQHFGLLIANVVRHTAKAFDVDESAVWEWVDKERADPTTDITVVHRFDP